MKGKRRHRKRTSPNSDIRTGQARNEQFCGIFKGRLKKGYHQLELHESARPITTFFHTH